MAKPFVFVGSALEDQKLLSNLQRKNTDAHFRYYPWTNLGSFPVGGYPIPSLLDCFRRSYGAVFLALGRDRTWWRGSPVKEPRDNVILEAGLAMGMLGPERVFVAADPKTKLPSDFAGLKPYVHKSSSDLEADADDLNAHIQHFFSSTFIKQQPVSYYRPERFPQLTWERLACSFPELDESEIVEAIRLIEERMYGEALTKVSHRDSVVGLYLQARIALLTGDFAFAQAVAGKLLTAALELVKAGKHDAYFFLEVAARRLVKCFRRTGPVRDQLENLSKVFSPPDLHHLRGLTELHAGRWKDAIRYYDEAIDAGSQNIWSYLDRAECYFHLGDSDRLWDTLRTVEGKWPDSINGECLFRYIESTKNPPAPT